MRGGPPQQALARQRQRRSPVLLHWLPGEKLRGAAHFCTAPRVLFFGFLFRLYFTVSFASSEVTLPMLFFTTQRYWIPL